MTTPTWLAATSGSPAKAGQVNQFLVAHQAQYVYAGAEQSSQGTAGSGGVNSNSLWIAQKFTAAAGQTTTGYVVLKLAVTGSPAAWTISLQADNGSGAPSGTPLVTTQIPKELVSAGSSVTVLLPAAGLTAGAVYWVVAQAVGDSSDFFTWDKSNQTSGASTSPNGTTWTAQSYGLLFQVWDGTVTGALAGMFEDAGARWTLFSYASGLLSGVAEWTAGQTPAGYAWSSRSLTYSSGFLTGVA